MFLNFGQGCQWVLILESHSYTTGKSLPNHCTHYCFSSLKKIRLVCSKCRFGQLSSVSQSNVVLFLVQSVMSDILGSSKGLSSVYNYVKGIVLFLVQSVMSEILGSATCLSSIFYNGPSTVPPILMLILKVNLSELWSSLCTPTGSTRNGSLK